MGYSRFSVRLRLTVGWQFCMGVRQRVMNKDEGKISNFQMWIGLIPALWKARAKIPNVSSSFIFRGAEPCHSASDRSQDLKKSHTGFFEKR
jgi:hypothetical protein